MPESSAERSQLNPQSEVPISRKNCGAKVEEAENRILRNIKKVFDKGRERKRSVQWRPQRSSQRGREKTEEKWHREIQEKRAFPGVVNQRPHDLEKARPAIVLVPVRATGDLSSVVG